MERELSYIQLDSISKYYQDGHAVFEEFSLNIEKGNTVAIIGPSGCGKSTLLNIIGLLMRPNAGQYLLDGVSYSDCCANTLATVRKKLFGYVFQSFYLLPQMSIVENIMLPLLYRKWSIIKAREEAHNCLTKMGLQELANNKFCHLSGGQKQRAAIARALIVKPKILLADEPTGQLDTHTGLSVMEWLFKLQADLQFTFIVVTHDNKVADFCRTTVKLIGDKK